MIDLVKKYKIYFIEAVIITAIIALSLVPRLNYVSEEPAYNNLGHIYSIITYKAWNEKGPAYYNFAPVVSFTKQGDSNMSEYKRLVDKDGNNYFVSYPPLAFISAYVPASIFLFLPVNILLTILALICHISTGLILYITLKKLFKPPRNSFGLPAIVSFSVIMFFPAFMFHSLSWFPEIFILPFWAWLIYLAVSIREDGNNVGINGITSFLIGFLMCYTDWIGYLIVFSILFYSILLNRTKALRKLSLLMTAGGIAAFCIMLIQYAGIDNTEALMKAWGLRFAERSGLFGDVLSDKGLGWLNSDTWLLLLKRAGQTLPGMAFMAFAMIAISFLFFKNRINFGNVKLVLFISTLPVLMHFVVLLNSNVIHFGSWAKLAVPIAVIAGIAVENILKNTVSDQKKFVVTGIVAVLILAGIVSSAKFNDFMRNYPTGEIRKEQALLIKANVKDDEAVCVKKDEELKVFLPYMEYIAERNISVAKDNEEVLRILEKNGQAKCVYFDFSEKNDSLIITRLSLP